MSDISYLATFLGWCSVINIAVLTITTLALMVLKAPIMRIHAKLFRIEPDRLTEIYFKYLANYKIAIIVFNLVPYIALRIMA